MPTTRGQKRTASGVPKAGLSGTASAPASSIRRKRHEPDTHYASSRILKIIVGNSEAAKSIWIHEDLLKRHSGNYAQKEQNPVVFTLAPEDSRSFEVFVSFIYTGNICSKKDTPQDENDDEWHFLGKCWVLGDRLSSTSFKDAVADAMRDKMLVENMFPNYLHETAYSGIDGNNSLKRLTVSMAMWSWSGESFQDPKLSSQWHEFFRDLCSRYADLTQKNEHAQNPALDHECAYHEHVAEGTSCYKTMF